MSSNTPPYLLPSYDPRTATMAELRGMLLEQGVPYSSTAKKTDLVQAYETSLRPRAPALLAELRKVRPSDRGILDGESQDGSLRELDTESEKEEREKERERKKEKKVKTKRKSAVPQPKRSRSRSACVQPREDIEMESADEAPEPSASRAKPVASTSTTATPSAQNKRKHTSPLPEDVKRVKTGTLSSAEKERQQALKYESGGESGFSDFNPFQSGGEDSPENKARRRKSSIGPRRQSGLAPPAAKAGRKSMPALPSDAAARVAAFDASTPSTPPVASGSGSRPSSGGVGTKYMVPINKVKMSPPEYEKLKKNLGVFEEPPAKAQDEVEVENYDEDDVEENYQPQEEEDEDVFTAKQTRWEEPKSITLRKWTEALASEKEQDRDVMITPKRTLGQGKGSATKTSGILVPKKEKKVDGRLLSSLSLFSSLALLVLFLGWWREERIAAGYCDTSSPSNSLVRQRQGSLVLPPWLPTPPSSMLHSLDALNLRPSCTTCPLHAICSNGKFLACEPDYVPSLHPLSFNGLLPIAPRCKPDTAKLMAVAMQASRAAKVMRKRRGEVVCKSGMEKHRLKAGKGEAWTYGLTAETLAEELTRLNEESDSPLPPSLIGDVNRLALLDLESHGEVLTLVDDDETWYAAKTAEMPLGCRMRKAAVRHAEKHKKEIAGFWTIVFTILWLRNKLQQRKAKNEQVKELVQTSLHQLRRQEHLHHSDPVLTPTSHIAPSHLRDLVLQHEHSPARRQLLWKQVEKVVEGNANVRAKQVTHHGEDMRAWEWTGGSGLGNDLETGSPARKMYPSLQ